MLEARVVDRALQEEEEETQSAYRRETKKELKKVSNRQWETISTVDGER